MAFNMRQLHSMEPGDEPQFLSWSGAKGIYYRLAQDSRSWYFRGTLREAHCSTPLRISLGDVREPRLSATFLENEAHRLRELCRQGIDPRKAPVALLATTEDTDRDTDFAPTMDAAWERYLSQKTGISETYRTDIAGKWRRSISSVLIPPPAMSNLSYQDLKSIWTEQGAASGIRLLGTIQVNKVTNAEIEWIFDACAGKASTAVHLRRILNPFLQYARRRYPTVAQGLLDRAMPEEQPSQERLLRDEIVRFGAALRGCDYLQRFNVLFLLLTGCRAGVLTNWNPAWVQGDTLFIPRRTPGLKDPRLDMCILLTPQAQALIPKLIPCTNSALRNAVILLCKQAGTKIISPHDLRRTYISEGCDIGQLEEIMLALTSHASKSQVGRIYNVRDLIRYMPQARIVADHFMSLLGEQGI